VIFLHLFRGVVPFCAFGMVFYSVGRIVVFFFWAGLFICDQEWVWIVFLFSGVWGSVWAVLLFYRGGVCDLERVFFLV